LSLFLALTGGRIEELNEMHWLRPCTIVCPCPLQHMQRTL